MTLKNISFLRSSIGKKIKASFVLVIAINVVYGLYIFFTLSTSIGVLNTLTDEINPTVESINAFKSTIENSKSYATNWIYVSKFKTDKEKLIEIHDDIYPALRATLINQIDTTSRVDSTDTKLLQALETFDQIVLNQQTIIETLRNPEDYDDMLNLLICQDLLESEIIPNSSILIEKVDQVLAQKNKELSTITSGMKSAFNSLKFMIILLSVLGTVTAILIGSWLANNITNPLKVLQEKVLLLSEGAIIDPIAIKTQDELGKMSFSINTLIESTKSLSKFASDIEKGNLDTAFEARGVSDVLGHSLMAMRNNLQKVISDTNEVVRIAAEDGVLGTKVDVADKEGVWKDLSSAINNLLSSISRPMRLLSHITIAMANGDLSKKYEESEKGEILNLTDSLNKAIDGLNFLLNKISENADLVGTSSTSMLTVSEEMIANIREIASAVGEISEGAQNQVTKVDEVSSLIEGILDSSNQMEEKAMAINTAAKEGFKNSEKGGEIIGNVSESIVQIETYAEKTNQSMEVLTSRSNEITRVLDVITEIASQTNLLALNAAIEAAQAGDAGRGFAVVAEEIRKLAEDSKKSALQIEQLVLDVQKDTKEASNIIGIMNKTVASGKVASDHASQVLKEIQSSNNHTLSHSEEIFQATIKQKENVSQVVSISESVVVIAEETAAGTEQSASAVTELSAGMNNFYEEAQQMEKVSVLLKSEMEKIILLK